jgi:hypothetical protein
MFAWRLFNLAKMHFPQPQDDLRLLYPFLAQLCDVFKHLKVLLADGARHSFLLCPNREKFLVLLAPVPDRVHIDTTFSRNINGSKFHDFLEGTGELAEGYCGIGA